MFKGFRKIYVFSRQISTNKYGKWTDTKRSRFIVKSWGEKKKPKKEITQVTSNFPVNVENVNYVKKDDAFSNRNIFLL